MVGVWDAREKRNWQTRTKSPCRRIGTSLPEVLVVIGIIGLLSALVLPAVQSSRVASRRASCQFKLRQIGVALHGHQAARGFFPRGGHMRGDNTGGDIHRSHAPHVYLLPFLEQDELFRRIDLRIRSGTGNFEVRNETVTAFQCPADPTPLRGHNNYRANVGLSLFPQSDSALTQIPPAGDGAFSPARTDLYPQHYLDGLSNTVAFSERIAGDGDESRYSPAADFFMIQQVADPSAIKRGDQMIAACASLASPAPWHDSYIGEPWLTAAIHTTWYNHLLTPNHPIPDCGSDARIWGFGVMTARSAHSGGVNCLMMDGAVRFVADTVNAKIWRAIATRNGSEPDRFE